MLIYYYYKYHFLKRYKTIKEKFSRMNTYLEIGVGKYIEKKFLTAKNEILISTPSISISLSKKLIE